MIIQCRFDYVNSIKTITYSRYTDMPQSSPFEYTRQHLFLPENFPVVSHFPLSQIGRASCRERV